jgi:hypothetical protein
MIRAVAGEQLQLLDDPTAANKRARRKDPDTSKAAAAQAESLAADHQAKILGSLLVQGDGTIYEIGARTGLDHVAVARRLPELQELGVARPTGEKRLGPNGRQCRVWRGLRAAAGGS